MSRHNIGFPLSAGGGGAERVGQPMAPPLYQKSARALEAVENCGGGADVGWNGAAAGEGEGVCVCVCVEAGVRARGSLTYDSSQVNLTWSAFARFKMRSFSALMYIPNFLIRYLLLSMTI
jgi:hypothetical protein